MCGICAYIGSGVGMFDLIQRGLVILQNRGYDAAGLAICLRATSDLQTQLEVYKKASTDEVPAIDYITDVCRTLREHEQDTTGAIISHLRWRTCGKNDDHSAHPALSYNRKFALVHNGIIENYMEIRADLESKGITFVSHTDTEVIVNLMGYLYETGTFQSSQTGTPSDPIGTNVPTEDTSARVVEAIRETLSRIEGTWGLVIMCVDEPNKLYCARHGSPLLIGFGDDFAMVASEQTGFSGSVQNFICLRDNDIVTLTKSGCNKHTRVAMQKIAFSVDAEHELRKVSAVDVEVSPTPFPHWTLKEIYEQREAVLRAICHGGRISSSSTVKLGGLAEHKSKLVDVDNLIILGCGSSYNAGMYAVETFRKISGFNNVALYDGADFTELHLPRDGKTALLLLSQSGETKDLHRALEIGKTLGLYMIGIVNVVDSLIAREVDCGVYLNAGREVGVAATKSFTSQVVVLHLVAVWFAQIRGLAEAQREDIIEGIRALSNDVEQAIYNSVDPAKRVAKYLAARPGMFVLGRGYSEAIARESALKIKEVSYVLAESYNSSALKHGPYSVLEQGFPVLLIAPTDVHLTRNHAVIDELASRDAFVVCIGDGSLGKTRSNIVIKTPVNRYFSSLLCIVAAQLIAYYTSVEKGTRVDTPRHLCKTVSTD